MKSNGSIFVFIIKLSLLWFYFFTIQKTKAASINYSDFEVCNAELEQKFMTDNVRCPHGGLFPVKGSCTSFIPCIRLGGDLMKPLRRSECSPGMVFDIRYLSCQPRRGSETCVQQKCFPSEIITTEEPVSVVSASTTAGSKYPIPTTTYDDRDEISISDDILLNQLNSTITNNTDIVETFKNSSNFVASSSVAERANFFIGLVFFVLFNFLFISKL